MAEDFRFRKRDAEFLNPILNAGDYNSEFETDSENEAKRAKRDDFAKKEKPKKERLASKSVVSQEYENDERKIHRDLFISMSAYDKHKKMVNDYLQYFGGNMAVFARDTSKDKTDMDIVRENHQFLWDDDDQEPEVWDKKLAKKYYDKLFKEYCIADLSKYKENKIAMRWRIEKEVISGKGQFVCGNKSCDETVGLRSWEVNFGYVENGEKKNALVKIRLCCDCSYKLNFKHRKKEIIPNKGKKDKKAAETISTGEPSQKKTEQTPSDKDKAEDGQPEEETSKWTGSLNIEDKSREDEFEEYLEDLFL